MQGLERESSLNRVYRLQCEFVDVTEALGLADVGSLHTSVGSVSLIDYDSDGNLDLYTTPMGALYRNTGGHFAPIQQFQEIVEQASSNPHTVAYADLDKDGSQDLLLQTFNGITYLRRDTDGNWIATPLIQP